MSSDSFQRQLVQRTNTLNSSIDNATLTILSRFQDILDIAINEGKDKYTVAPEVYQIECHTVSMVRAVEQLLDVSRQIKSYWLTNSLSTSFPTVDYSEPDLEKVKRTLTKLQNHLLEVSLNEPEASETTEAPTVSDT